VAKGVRVKLISRGLRELLLDDGVAGDLRTRSDRVLAAAAGSAPEVTGAYKRSLEVRVVRHGDRNVGQVHATVPHAHLVELRTNTLARSLDAGLGR
jgi:hypothetical protein